MATHAAQLLRDVRRRHGLTQAQLAARARTSQAAISRIERGLVSPSVVTLAELLHLMGEGSSSTRSRSTTGIRALVEHEVDFVVVWGLATMALGSAYRSYDLDIAYARDPENLQRLAAALRELMRTCAALHPTCPSSSTRRRSRPRRTSRS